MRAPKSWKQPRKAWCVGIILCGAISAGIFTRLSAELTPPAGRERQVTVKVVEFLSKQHLSKQPIDDRIASRALKLYLEGFDPLKVYFTQADVDEFRQNEKQLDDLLNQGRIEFAYTVYNRFVQRIDERVKLINELLQEDFDFTVDEEAIIDPDIAQYPKTPEEIRDRWRKRLKFDLLSLKADKTEGEAAKDKLRHRYQNFARRMKQFDNDELLETYLNSFTMSFDPHTSYMSPSQLDNFRILMRLNLEGIGAKLQTNDFGQTVIAEIVPGGAADKYGQLKPEDQIVSVGQGEEGEMVDVVEMKLSDVVKLIRGKAGTTVRLGIKRTAESETEVHRIVRAQIELKDSEAEGKVIDVNGPAGEPYKIGVINLPSFYMDMEASRLNSNNYKSTTRDVRKILQTFRQSGVDAVVLDLRRNGGGSLVEAIDLTGLFIDKGPVVQVQDSAGTVDHYDDTKAGLEWDGPLVVITSKFSASASEILAGAIQDYRRGLIVGDKSTHGKGTVQTLRELGERLFPIPNPPNQGAIKITVQQFFRPNGESTQQRGVMADIELPARTTHLPIAESDLEYSLPFSKVAPVPFAAFELVNSELVKALRERSATRIAASEDFQKVQVSIDHYLAQKEQKTVSLNEQKYMAQRAALDVTKELEEEVEGPQGGKSGIEQDYYLNEVLAITADYVSALSKNTIARTR